jgi:DNA-binding NarL/FixJ family response regulator
MPRSHARRPDTGAPPVCGAAPDPCAERGGKKPAAERIARLLLADAQPVYREGLRRVLDAAPGLRVLAEADTGEAALRAIRAGGFDALILAADLPDLDPFEGIVRLKQERPAVAVLVLAPHPTPDFALRVLRAGGAGCLGRDAAPAAIVEAAYATARGEHVVTAAVREALVAQLHQPGNGLSHERLSTREFQVFRLLARGRTTPEVAEALALSPSTVRTYRARVFDKMGMAREAELMRYALDHGLLD